PYRTVFVPWDLVRSHQEPMASWACRGYPLARLRGGLALGLAERRDCAELLEEAQGVEFNPLLDDLALDNPEDVQCAGCQLLAGGCVAHELPPMGARATPAGHHLVALGYQILNRKSDVG